jgi:hypothetical protein
MNRSRKYFVAAALALSVLTLATSVQAWCTEDFAVLLAPRETQTFTICSYGDPLVGAQSEFGEDVDLRLYTASGRLLDSDTDLDGFPLVTARASGYNEYAIQVTNATTEFVYVVVSVR